MIRKRGAFTIHETGSDLGELHDSVENLPNGDYEFLIYDKFKNRSLPQLKYLFGVVLKTISDELPEHPPVDALYRWFEQVYAPHHSCIIDGQTFEYVDLKNENSVEMDAVIQRIIHHAAQEWQISIPDKETLKTSEARELYTDAYTDVWKSFLHNSQQSKK